MELQIAKKAAKKIRQRQRREVEREKKARRQIASEDKAFASYASKSISNAQPHLQWQVDRFVPMAPAPSPRINIEVSIMHSAHEKLGRQWKGSRQGIFNSNTLSAIADTGCQTCTIGAELLPIIKCPTTYLIPTKHRIIGITDTSLGIIGAVLLRLNINGQSTRQMVYVSSKIKGLYLSETALVDLGIISRKFPHPQFVNPGAAAKALSVQTVTSEICDCPKRTATPDRPKTIPFDPTLSNLHALQQWLLSEFASSAFNTCTHQKLQIMTGKPVEISFKTDSTPSAVHTPIPIPHHWKYQVKEDINRDVRLGIIEAVPQGNISKWCSRMVVAPKKDGTPRRTVDLQRLNKATHRETHHTPTPFNIVSVIPPGTRKTVLDAWNGYHSLPLSSEAKEATTFITEWSRFRYCRAPMGFHTSGDAYTRRFDDITVNVERKARCIDDSLLWDTDIEQSFWHTFDYIKLCADNGIFFTQKNSNLPK